MKKIADSDVDSDLEIRLVYYGELVCPNPREYYKNTRSYDDMRSEYDLLTCYKLTEDEVNDLELRLK